MEKVKLLMNYTGLENNFSLLVFDILFERLINGKMEEGEFADFLFRSILKRIPVFTLYLISSHINIHLNKILIYKSKFNY